MTFARVSRYEGITKIERSFFQSLKFLFVDKDYSSTSFSPDCSKLPCSAESRSKTYKERFGILLQKKLKRLRNPLK
jgi:hypothetical protein